MLADPKRLRIVGMLRDRELSVGELAEALGVAYPNVSQHLNVMRDAGLVATRRSGTNVSTTGRPTRALPRPATLSARSCASSWSDAAELAGR